MPEQQEQKTGRRLILMDGTTIEDGGAGSSAGMLWCWVTGMTMPQAAQVFFDPTKTGKIIFEYGEMSDEYDGYTNCTNLFIDGEGKVSVCLTRGASNV